MPDLTVSQVADRLGISERGVLQHIARGNLNAYRFGKVWAITEDALNNMRRRPVGRPPASSTEKGD